MWPSGLVSCRVLTLSMSCSCEDLIRLHVLALDAYDAVAYYVRDLVGCSHLPAVVRNALRMQTASFRGTSRTPALKGE